MSVLIWVQTVCKGYQQTTKLDVSKEIVKHGTRVKLSSNCAKRTAVTKDDS